MTHQPFKIGSTPLRKDRIDAAFLKSMREAAGKSTVRKGRKAAQEALESWAKEKELSPEEFAKLDDYAGGVADKHAALKDRWWDNFKSGNRGAALKKLEQRMAREGDMLLSHRVLTNEYREATALSAVKAIAGTSVGPAGVMAAYVAYSNGPNWTGAAQSRAQDLWTALQSLEDGTSRMSSDGNSVERVDRADLWKTMNTTLDRATEEAKAGDPKELDLQYYELTSPRIIGKIAKAGQAGNKVRINLDAGRLSFPSRDSEGDYYFSLDSTPDKLRTLLQLAKVPKADIAVSLFPQKKMLNSSGDLMHRKIMRYGDQVLISGMNANKASGENVDAGFMVEGPAAKQLGENFKRDVESSTGATTADIWGEEQIQKFAENNLRMGKRGFVSLFDSLAGPTPAGTELPEIHSLEELEALAKKAGAKLKTLVEVPADEYEATMTKVAARRAQVPLSPKGKALIQDLIRKAVETVNKPKNIKKLADITPPSGEKVGTTKVDIADLPVEREAMAIKTISEAEEFIYMPSFVLTRGIAAAIVARRDQLAEQGQELDVRVIADSGLYPHGSTPNAIGVKMLEDNGIAPRWSKLERTHWHDRKIHAKQLLTDKGAIAGSTNFSNKGLKENWETSAYVHYDENDTHSVSQREEAKSEFQSLWDTSFELSTVDHAAYLTRKGPEDGRGWQIEDNRDRSVRHILRQILNYEKDTAKMLQSLVEQVPAIADARDKLLAEGYSHGNSTIIAVKEHVGPNSYQELLESVPANQTLKQLQADVAEYKETGAVASDDAEAEPEVVGALSEQERTFRAHFI